MRSLLRLFVALALVLAVLLAALFEMSSGTVQSLVLSSIAARCRVEVLPGADSSVQFPSAGPLNQRRGYTLLPQFISSLRKKGFSIQYQAHWPSQLKALVNRGYTPIYREKPAAGLTVLDRRGDVLFRQDFPVARYSSFDSIPLVIRQTLLFIEDRQLLDTTDRYRNPAVNWGRLTQALLSYGVSRIVPGKDAPGASTLATQIEKFRYSSGGRTGGLRDKYVQMSGAAMRAYSEGRSTVEARKNIVRDYLNETPLSGYPGYGEVNGLAEGLAVWYGASMAEINRSLRLFDHDRLPDRPPLSPEDLSNAGAHYRMVLSLLVAQRRPSYYLLTDREALARKTAVYLADLADEGIIPTDLLNAALNSAPPLRSDPLLPTDLMVLAERKSANVVRSPMLSLLGMPRLYDLDRLDISVSSVLDGPSQKRVVGFFERLASERLLDSLGLRSERMMRSGNPAKVVYSLALYERSGPHNLLRVQADSYERLMNFNEGTRLDLGSTAKLRTLITYLEIIELLHARFVASPPDSLPAVPPGDELSRWARDYALHAQDTTITAMLKASLERTYSASPHSRFFTGGGIHEFANFDPNDNGRTLTVREAFQRSVNLVFIRMMKDIVSYHVAASPVGKAFLADSLQGESRLRYLEKFTRHEGRTFIGRFYNRLKAVPPETMADTLAADIRPNLARLAVIYTSVSGDTGLSEFRSFLNRQGHRDTAAAVLGRALREYDTTSFDLADRGYIATIHPLKLWVAGYLSRHPGAGRKQVEEAGMERMSEVYRWLYKTSRTPAQDKRIRMVLEMEAFYEIHKSWARQGYPFPDLVPSYATSIGSSADRPAALAELAGIIQNGGIRLPVVRVKSLTFAAETPYETTMRRVAGDSLRVLSPQLAAIVKECMYQVVERGTASRIKGALTGKTGEPLRIGGKTGTGDQRFKMFDHSGRLTGQRSVNRTATFVFLIGDRYFGTISALVPGEQAQEYAFTSSYPVQLLKLMLPMLSIDPSDNLPSPEHVRELLTAEKAAHEPPLFSIGRLDSTLSSPEENQRSTETD